MTTLPTDTVRVTIDAPVTRVANDLADVAAHPSWATEFFEGSARRDGAEWLVQVPRMGGPARMRIDADAERGIVDMYLAPGEAPYGPPLPVRVVPNGDGCDVLFTLTRSPGLDDQQWAAALDSMSRELQQLRSRLED